MATPRANWKGYIKFGEVSCPVALYTAVSSSDRIAFNTLNRKTGNRVSREFIDSETGETVERDDQIKGYETESGRYVILEPDEIASAVPDSDKTLKIDAFIPCTQIDTIYFDKPYYLLPDKLGVEAFVLLREGLKKQRVAAIARTVLFRRMRTVLIRPHENGLIATTLNFDYEVRSAEEAFDNVPKIKLDEEMLDLAEHIINKKRGKFDAGKFEDRYEAAVAELVKAKIDGRKLPKRKTLPASKPTDLLQALRESANMRSKKTGLKRSAANTNRGANPKKSSDATPKTPSKSKSAAAQKRRAS